MSQPRTWSEGFTRGTFPTFLLCGDKTSILRGRNDSRGTDGAKVQAGEVEGD